MNFYNEENGLFCLHENDIDSAIVALSWLFFFSFVGFKLRWVSYSMTFSPLQFLVCRFGFYNAMLTQNMLWWMMMYILVRRNNLYQNMRIWNSEMGVVLNWWIIYCVTFIYEFFILKQWFPGPLCSCSFLCIIMFLVAYLKKWSHSFLFFIV